MKRLALIVLAVMGIAVASVAQNGKGKAKLTPEERANRTTNRMEKELDLTSDQKIKIYELNRSRAAKIDELKAKYGEDKQAIGKEMKAFNMERKKELMTILNKDQQGKLKKVKEERKKKKGEKGKGKGKGGNKPAKDKEPKTEQGEEMEDEEFED